MIMTGLSKIKETLVALLICAGALALSACAALQPPDSGGPRSNLPAYPLVANEQARLDEATVAWKQLSQANGLPPETDPDLHPLTGTLRITANNSAGSIFLPRVGSAPTQSEEEVRESLRRFLVEWRSLIGADPNQLSLVERTDEASGLRIARYEQRPFRYPLRGEFGKLTIRFRTDRRLVDISSTCLPNAERLQGTLASLSPDVTAEEAALAVKGSPINAPDSTGQIRNFTLAANAAVDVKQLVAYALPSPDQQTLELHLAWEIDVTNGPIKTIYLDVITKQVIAVA